MKNALAERSPNGVLMRKRSGVSDLGAVDTVEPRLMTTRLTYLFTLVWSVGTTTKYRYGTIPAAYSSFSNANLGYAQSNEQITFAHSGNSATDYMFFHGAGYGGYVTGAGAPGPTQIASVNYPGPAPGTTEVTAQGSVFLDGYFFVLTTTGVICNSDLNTAATWGALSRITANAEYGAGVCLVRSQNFVVALKEFSIEPFYNAGNSTGSPLLPVQSGVSKVGCASAASVASLGDDIFWISQDRAKGRSITKMTGLRQETVSTPDVSRILNADTLATVYSCCVNIGGHSLYVLTMTVSNITLVYDDTEKTWLQWSSLTLGASIGGTITITRDGTTATWTSTNAHGLSDGDAVLISGCTQTEYNGIFQLSYISTTSFSFEVTGSPATPATGTPVGKGYTESYFKFTQYALYNGMDLFMHVSDGHLYQMLPTLYQDAGIPIDVDSRLTRFDAGNNDIKPLGKMAIIGDKVSDTAMVRWSDDDYQSYQSYRRINLAYDICSVRRLGSFRRRVFQFRYIGNNPINLQAYEI